MSLVKSFIEICRAPAFIEPYLHFFVTEQEMEFVVACGGKWLSVGEFAALLPQPPAELAFCLEQAYLRHILDKEHTDTVRYSAGNFYYRLKHFCLFGNYHILPATIRQQLDAWDFAEYLRQNNYFKQVLGQDPDYGQCHNEWILLVEEAEAMIDAAAIVRLLPCDCKMLADQCDYSREICLVLDPERVTDRSGGRELTKEQAKELIRKLDKEGLMHTGGPPDWQQQGPAVICNCCACCCYPFRAARLLGTKGKWPKSRYVATFDRDKCLNCGLCSKRCHFDAFYVVAADAVTPRYIEFNAGLCWGCGICVASCPAQAIGLTALAGRK